MAVGRPEQAAHCALVTGSAGGLGRAIALRLARNGLPVVLIDADGEGNDDTLALVREAGVAGVALTADISMPDSFSAAVAEAEASVGPIGVLVNNAGIEGPVAPIWSYDTAAFDTVWNVNVRGALLGMKCVMPKMIERGEGAVVNVASTSAIRGRKGLAGYVASKHALLGLTRSAALDAAEFGVRVNAVLPGPVRGAMIERLDAKSGGIERAGQAALADPEDIAGTVEFLVSEAARHINGAALVVDGGATIL